MDILESIYYEYTETQEYINDEKARQAEEQHRLISTEIEERYGQEVADYVSDTVSTAESAYEKAGFIAGFRIAVQLMQACRNVTPNLFKEAKTA